jgi:hypothetical protein
MTTPDNDNHGYVTATEAARQTGLPGTTVRYWARHGKIGTIEPPTGRLVLLRDVEHLASLTRQTTKLATNRSADNGAETLSRELSPILPTVVTHPTQEMTTANALAAIAATLAAELTALREERERTNARHEADRARLAERLQEVTDAARSEHDELLARALAAEWEAARLRPLTVLPDPPVVRRRRWW